MATPAERQAALRYRNDPVFFVRTALNGNPWEKQEEILRSVAEYRRTAVRSCHGIGKTRVASWTAVWFLCTHPSSRVITTAPTWFQVKTLLWNEIASIHEQAPWPLGGSLTTTEWRIGPDWFAIGQSTNKPERFQGHHAEDILLICDEASGIAQPIYEASEGFLTSAGSRLLLIGNPTQLAGEFYDAFHSPRKRQLYNTIAVSAFDTPNLQAGQTIRPYLITPEWVEEKRLLWGEESPMWAARVLGDFPRQGSDTLIPLAWIEAAQWRWHETEPDDEDVVLGVDVARYGTDATVIMERRGLRASVWQELRSMDTMRVTGAVVKGFRETNASAAHVDVIGVGSGVADRLKEQEYAVAEMNGAEKPRDTKSYQNARAEWYWLLRERFRTGEIAIDPDDDVLAGQLASMKYKYMSNGKLLIESKDDMKARGLPSPDRADALMYAFAPASVGGEWGDLFAGASVYG